MKRRLGLVLLVMLAVIALLCIGCGVEKAPGEGTVIIDAKDVKGLLSEKNAILVDMQSSEGYADRHIKGAINIILGDIVKNEPVKNMLADAESVAKLIGGKGISNDTMVVIYDNSNNMDAARLWWTLKVYGHEKVKVVSGGLVSLIDAGYETSDQAVVLPSASYSISSKNNDMIATLDEVKAQVDNQKENVVLLDTRSQKEYQEGRIPGALNIDYMNNNFTDGTFKPAQHIKIQYVEKEITSEKTILMYCKTSIRAAQTYLALYNAGYRNLKLYDGAWLQWSSYPSLPVQMPTEKPVVPDEQDMS